MHRSGHLKTLKDLATARNLNSTAMYQNNVSPHENEKGLAWFEENIESNQHENLYTLDSSHNHKANNHYKRSHKAKSKACNTSDGGKGMQLISEIHPSSKEHSEDVNGTLMNSIVNLFPNKFKSKKGSGVGPNDINNPVSSFSSSPQGSLSKEELQEKLRKIKKSRESMCSQQLKESHDSNDILEQCDPHSANSGHETRLPSNIIDNKSYFELLEAGELMKNVNGDVL